ncbi:hypothetical protein HYW21_02700 [Candidatus Woesearchaeota archaeon]|nr:hypothetical protein [Candidatus Woesearchaeota archaeon]
MNLTVKKDINAILLNAAHALQKNDAQKLKLLSNQTIHNASIFQDEYSVSIAVAIYALFKVIEDGNRELQIQVIPLLLKANRYLIREKIKHYKQTIKEIFRLIGRHDARLKLFVDEVIQYADVKKGSKLFEHGLSTAMAAQVLGISQWELMEYIGKTKIVDRQKPRIGVEERLSFARRLFQ